MKIAIQGIKGSFHHAVALNYFGEEIEIIDCSSFQEIAQHIEDKTVDFGIMAIENSIAGALLPNYALIDEYNLAIKGEYFLPIAHNLMTLPKQSIHDIKEVYSHPMALLQCRRFFNQYPHIKLIEATDTASAAKRIADHELIGIGAIASHTAANIYQLDIVAEGIQTIQNNFTRFFILNKKEDLKVGKSKASLKLILNHETGSLGFVLNLLAKHKLNLTKIQSMPIIETPWIYAFFIDVCFEDYQAYKKAIQEVAKHATELKILGEYQDQKPRLK